MTIDPERLLNWQVPDGRTEASTGACAFYALSVGFGQDPLDEEELRFVDPSRPDLLVAPTMALVLGYPGFWLGNPATGVDATRVVHTEQSIEFLGPLPQQGLVTGTTRVTDLFDRGVDRGAVLHSERRLAVDGREFAALRQVHMLRGDGGFGGQPPERARSVEYDTAPSHRVRAQTRPEQALYYRLNGDMNPVHSVPAVARKAGFDRPILHGMCTFGIIGRALLKTALANDPTRLRTISMRFVSPVTPGETLVVEIYGGNGFRAVEETSGRVVADRGVFSLK